MSEIDAKVNMSLDEIIKMENKKKRQKDKKSGPFRNNPIKGGNPRGGRATTAPGRRNNVQKRNLNTWKQRQGKVQAGFVRKKNAAPNGMLFRSKSNNNLRKNNNQRQQQQQQRQQQQQQKLRTLRLRTGRLPRSKSRSNVVGFMSNARFGAGNENKLMNGKRTNSMPNLRDPNSVHNRLGYQTPAQLAYRNRIKRAKQMLLQNQKLNMQNNMRARANQAATSLTTYQRAMELRQQALLPQRGYGTSGLRSDLILRAQRRAQYEEKMMRIKAAQQMNNLQNFKLSYPSAQRNMNTWFSNLKSQNNDNVVQQLSRGRSPYRQNAQNMQRAQSFNRRSRSRSRSRTTHDRAFSEVMYSLSDRFGTTEKSLNERFSEYPVEHFSRVVSKSDDMITVYCNKKNNAL